ncbi:MAG: calcium/sodium antiporter [Planctomycetota bacterium]|jgi:cation:H+ antiporter
MDVALHFIYLIGGLAVLWKCADLLVSGAVGLAERLGVSSLVIGLTVVAMGTSAPEAAASIAGVLSKENGGDLAIGNVFGSNVANLALVGGLIAILRPLHIKKKTLMREVPVMLLVGLLLWPMLRNGRISRIEGVSLLAVFAGLIVLTLKIARREGRGPEADIEIPEPDEQHPPETVGKCILLALVGLAGLAAGAKMTVVGAIFIGQLVGLTSGVVSQTFIALGTSLPELVTCVVATLRGKHDLSVGNLVGSNIFNTVLVTGAAGTVRSFHVSELLAAGIDYWIMLAVGAVFALIAIVGRRKIGRTGGAFLVCIYIAYILYQFGLSQS